MRCAFDYSVAAVVDAVYVAVVVSAGDVVAADDDVAGVNAADEDDRHLQMTFVRSTTALMVHMMVVDVDASVRSGIVCSRVQVEIRIAVVLAVHSFLEFSFRENACDVTCYRTV